MRDQFEREIEYLRISVTDRCNLRCQYCMPDGIRIVPMADILTYEEILETSEAAADLGVRYIRLTGGEPLVRPGVCTLLRGLKRIPGIEKVTMTTNGILLRKMLPELTGAGLDAVNISMDTADPEIFRQITGRDGLADVLASLDAALRAGLPVKINAVSLDLGRDNLNALLCFARELPVDVRFIEMMPIGYGAGFSAMGHDALYTHLREAYPDLEPDPARHGFGPAVYYRIPGWKGSIGLISAIHGQFCSTCNRVRLTSQGFLKPCLCYGEGADLRTILRSGLPAGERSAALRRQMRDTVFGKPAAHCFDRPQEITEHARMSAIGG